MDIVGITVLQGGLLIYAEGRYKLGKELDEAMQREDADEVVKLLYQSRDLIDCSFELGQNILHRFVGFGYASKVAYLVRSFPDLAFGKDNYGDTPSHKACLLGNVDVVEALLRFSPESFKRWNVYNRTPLHAAAFSNKAHIMEILLEKNPILKDLKETCYREQYSIAHAAIEGHASESLNYILKWHPDLIAGDRIRGIMPLGLAAERGCDEFVVKIIESFPSRDLLSLRDRAGRRVLDHAHSLSTQILLCWYSRETRSEAFKPLKDFAWSLKEGTPLNRASADSLAFYIAPYWPDELKRTLLLSASPKLAHRILSGNSQWRI
jgi:ankyrin repeat protein